MYELKPTDARFEYSGRWLRSPSGTMSASWCSAALHFLCSSSAVRIRTGGGTLRKNPWNGGTPMLAWSVHVVDSGTRDSGPPIATDATDAVPFQELCLF